MTKNSKHFYEFGDFHLNPREKQLLRAGEVITLTPKAFGVLLLFVENNGHLLAKEDFMREVWPDSIVEEKNIADNVSILRKVLGDNADAPAYIETVRKRGYRFVAKVIEVMDEGDNLIIGERTRAHAIIEETDESDPNAIETSAAATEKRLALSELRGRWGLKPLLIPSGLLLAGLLAFGTYSFFGTAADPATTSTSPIKSIAVLPFSPLAGDSRDEYLELGMADALITRLSSVRQILVRPTSAIRRYTDLEQDPVAAGRELTVDSVLEGNIQRAGDRLRVTVTLLRVADGTPLWAEKFDEKFTDIFSVQDSISQRVALALVPRLNGEEKERLSKHYTENEEAYQHYLRGRYHWNRRTADGMNKAIEHLNQAVAKDPSFALAYAALADAYALMPEISNAPLSESMMKSKQASLKALELDNTLAEAYISLAYAKYVEWDWQNIEEQYRRGLELNPNYATGHQWYSEYLLIQGRPDESMREIRLAQQLDPLSLIINTRIGMTAYYSRRYDEAIEQLRKTLEFNPEFILTHIFLCHSLFERGAQRETIPHIVKGFFSPYTLEEKAKLEAELNWAYEAGGAKAVWEKVRETLLRDGPRDYNYPFTMAETCLRLGDKDAAFLWLGRAADLKHPGVAALKVEPAMDGLRSDPRFAELLRRVNLPQ